MMHRITLAMFRKRGGLLGFAAVVALGHASAAIARGAGEPIKLVWKEGDVAGMTRILAPDGQATIGSVEYHQHRRGDVLETVRVARFSDGSSDEDQAAARAGETLEALYGRSMIRDTQGRVIVDLSIDVAGGRIHGFSGLGDERELYDERVELPSGTYWGALIFIVLKNFDANASDDRLVFRTVAATPSPRTIDLELVRDGRKTVFQTGHALDVTRFTLRPTINWLIDPILQRIAPHSEFMMRSGSPPALARYSGPRNYTGQGMLLE